MSGSAARQLRCNIEQVSAMNHDVYRVDLRLPAGDTPRFRAGQYLQLLPTTGEPSAFSIASSPGEVERNRLIELHLRVTQDNQNAQQLLAQLQNNTEIELRIAFGDCCLEHAPECPLILLAGSTGYAQARAVIKGLLDQGHQNEIHLYWGGRVPEDLYSTEPAEWAASHEFFTYHPVISDTESDNRSGLVHESVLEDFANLSDKLIIASGSPAMVYAALDAFEQRGASMENMWSDVFSYAPRDPDVHQ